MRFVAALITLVLLALAPTVPAHAAEEPPVKGLFLLTDYPAVSVRPGENTVRTHRFVLRRTEISGEDTLLDFEKKLAGAYDGWHRAVQSLERLQRRRHR